ncbi:MAG TPA: ATP-binding protein [Verrucomicrobiae bacterium]|nr:ATP-binding protein [Verrucomicrobiae bacterium]
MKTKSRRPDRSRSRTTNMRRQGPGRLNTNSHDELEARLKQLAAETRQKTRQLSAMARKLIQVEQHERGRLADILHDHVQQLLLSARLQLSLVNQDQLPIAERKAVWKVDEIISATMRDCRSLAVDLCPPILHEAGLGEALGWLARRMFELHRFTVHLAIDSRVEPQTEDLRVFLFGAMRELLLNSCKHSGCTSARVKITLEPNDWIKIVVEDAGKGFDPNALNTGDADGARFGLATIQQRLAHLGARMELESVPGAGTRIEILARTPLGRHPQQKASRETFDPPQFAIAHSAPAISQNIGSHCVPVDLPDDVMGQPFETPGGQDALLLNAALTRTSMRPGALMPGNG